MHERPREWTIHEVVAATGTTSRTLRHYADVGLLAPSRTGAGGYRYDDAAALRRLQRILLLRDLGLGLAVIADVLAARVDEATALRTHLALLEEESRRMARLAAGVRTTLETTGRGEIEVSGMFDGFEGGRYEEEVGGAALQELVARHHAWVSVSWTPDAAAYRRLLRVYVDDERFRAVYDAHGPGTAQYLARAADVFADRALS